MHISRKWLVTSIAALSATGLVFLAVRHMRAREHALSDGSILRVEKISYGKQEQFKIGGWLRGIKDQLQNRLPRSWSTRMFKPTSLTGTSNWGTVMNVDTNNDALWIWFTRRDPATGNYLNVNIRTAQLLDSHGCPLAATQMGGSDDGRLAKTGTFGRGLQGSVEWLQFEVFPRHEKRFRLRVYNDQGNFLTEFIVPNPAFAPIRPTNWLVEPLPIAKSYKNVTFLLTRMNIKTNFDALTNNWPRAGQPLEINPTFEFLEGGVPSTEWQALDMDLYDSSGNLASEMIPRSRFLCLQEPAWKLRVKFYGSEEANSASNILWSVRGIKVPAAGEFIPLDSTRTVQGIQVEALALAGPGSVTYSNEVPIKATSENPTPDDFGPINQSSPGNNRDTGERYTMRKVSFKTPQIAMYISGLTNDQRLTIRATDDQGRHTYAKEWFRRFGEADSKQPGEIHYLENRYYMHEPSFFASDLPADSKIVDLTFCIHGPTAVEFIFKPPALEAPPDK